MISNFFSIVVFNDTYFWSLKDAFDFDLNKIAELCKEIGVTFYKKDDVKFINRGGERPRNGNPRPMVIGFRTQTCRDAIFGAVGRLRNTGFKEVRIVADLTKMQRDKEQALNDECLKRNNNRTPDEIQAFL